MRNLYHIVDYNLDMEALNVFELLFTSGEQAYRPPSEHVMLTALMAQCFRSRPCGVCGADGTASSSQTRFAPLAYCVVCHTALCESHVMRHTQADGGVVTTCALCTRGFCYTCRRSKDITQLHEYANCEESTCMDTCSTTVIVPQDNGDQGIKCLRCLEVDLQEPHPDDASDVVLEEDAAASSDSRITSTSSTGSAWAPAREAQPSEGQSIRICFRQGQDVELWTTSRSGQTESFEEMLYRSIVSVCAEYPYDPLAVPQPAHGDFAQIMKDTFVLYHAAFCCDRTAGFGLREKSLSQLRFVCFFRLHAAPHANIVSY